MNDGGLSSFQRRMRAVPQAAREAIKPVLVKQADEMAGAMRALAPVDDGDLKASIAVTGPGLATPAHSQPGGAMVVPENAVAITAGNSDVRYAHLVEFGTAPHEVTKGASSRSLKGKARNAMGLGNQHPGASPQPFFWPAFRLHRKKALGAIKRGIGKAIREAR
ncbi:HK97-gp10 family putative phage morphogenesis protein [Paracoccus sp. (in: a-proteobacteria)]|uniref:HK97-gp10 family putative phage morphogenesis protein n=1 Tax=Paracoccus sp. TaxID=267 RepID=UPI002AFF809C|nr:HK97-gp10 family putative phage morphogenesis protein [Paracoccus sp. (in: a-proteobacteria)]